MRKWYPWLLVGLAFGFSAAMYQRLPAEIPSHWGTSGEVNGTMSRAFGAKQRSPKRGVPIHELFCLWKEWMMKSTTAIEMHESATLKAGHGSAYRTCRSNRRKSITCR